MVTKDINLVFDDIMEKICSINSNLYEFKINNMSTDELLNEFMKYSYTENEFNEMIDRLGRKEMNSILLDHYHVKQDKEFFNGSYTNDK